MADAPLTRPRWYRITPDRFVIGILAMVALVWLSERFDWFTLGHHKGWAVLIAVAAFAAAMLLLVLLFVAALLFRWRFQFGIRSLLLLGLIVALLCSWMAVKIRAAKKQHDTYEELKRPESHFVVLRLLACRCTPGTAVAVLTFLGMTSFMISSRPIWIAMHK